MRTLRFARSLASSALLFTALLLFNAGDPAFAQDDGCTAPPWDETVAYSRGDLVSYAAHEWKAKRNTRIGVVPGTHKPTWQDLGACAGDSPTEPPPEPPVPPDPVDPVPLQVFGVWHAGDHYADWANPRDLEEFDAANHWIIDRGDGTPSVNLVVLSFLQPMQVFDMKADPETGLLDPTTGVPEGMTQEIVDYFKKAGIRVMMSIGGVTYTDYWDEALTRGPIQLAENAALIAAHFGVGIEIDYERNVGANVEDLDTFITTYRDFHPFDPTGANPAARLTIDLAAGGRYLQELNRYATVHWLGDDPTRRLDYANAMVARRSGTPDNWQEHIDGMPTYDPVIPPKPPRMFTGGLYLKGDMANCLDFLASEQWAHAEYVRTVAPNGAGENPGMLGYMFWAAGTPSARKNYTATVPPNTCEDGMGTAMSEFEVVVPMPPLEQP